jgi:competence protein ComFC
MRCRDRTVDLARNVALFPYLGTVRELVHLYKAAGHRSVAVLFASLLAEAYRREFDGLPLVPVPGRRAVRRRRGWEHVDLLATILERQHAIPVARCLARRRGNVQKTLDYDGRLRNIAGKYVLRAPGPERAVLLDDVLTTGATLSECARILRESGSAWVGALTIAVDE